jgi:trimeric autotransporter adhesin
MIQLDRADTIHYLGNTMDTTVLLSVSPGWNWLGYPRTRISEAANYLAPFNAAPGDQLKSQTQFTQYNAGGWSGSINYLYPGQGYKLKSTNGYNVVIAAKRGQPSWQVEDNKYQQNLSITADLQFNGVSTLQSHYVVGAFDNGIGMEQPIYIASLKAYRVFMTIHGDTAIQGHAITFKVYDTDNNAELIPTYSPLTVIPDTAIASILQPQYYQCSYWYQCHQL